MVWLNTQHINESCGPGVFGGSRCTCQKCNRDRILSSLSKNNMVVDFNELSESAKDLIFHIITTINTFGYIYSVTIEWAYDVAINKHRCIEPPEGKSRICEIINLILKKHTDESILSK